MEYVIVLTTSPEAGLSDETIAGVWDALSGPGEARRLGESAAEIAVPTRQVAVAEGVDINCVPAANRLKKLLIADMDSTMIPVECIDEVADFAGVREQVVAITEPAMRGEISFEEALRARVALMKGLPAEQLQQVYDERITPNPGALVLVRTMQARGAYTALVSGGFTFFTERVAKTIGFDEHRANTLLIEGEALTGTVGEPILGREAKLDALNELTDRLGIGPEDVIAVGDGANDLAMIEAAGMGVAYHAKPVVAEAADSAITHGNLSSLLFLQGISASEFIR